MSKTINHQYELGVELRDRVTGLKGITTGITVFLNGCVQYLIHPTIDKDGKVPDAKWIDEAQLEQVGDGLVPKVAQAKRTGGDMAAPTSAGR